MMVAVCVQNIRGTEKLYEFSKYENSKLNFKNIYWVVYHESDGKKAMDIT